MAIAICADAVTDPLVGSISDRFRSKYGRRHPFLFFAPIPLVITIFLIFSPPEAVVASKLGLFIWFVTFTVLLRTFQTIFAIPLLAMGAELSTDYTERSKIMSFESLFGLYGYVFMHVVAMIGVFGLLFEDQGGRLYQPAYTPVMLICCLFVLVTLFACAYGTRDQIPLLRQHETDTPRASLRGLFSDIVSVMKNRNYRALLFGLFFLAVTAGTHETLSLYVATFLWDLNSYQLGFLILGNIVGTHLAFAVTPTLHHRFDRRWAIFWSCLIFSIFWSMPTNLKLLGIGPDAATWNAVLFIGCLKVVSVCAGVVLTISVMAALADIADEHDLLTGQRQEGIFYSARTFFSKAMNAFGHIIAGFAIDYYIKLPPKSVPGEVAEDVVFRLGIIDGPFAMLWGIVGAFVYLGYRIDRQRYEEIRTQLDQRKLLP